MIFDYCLNSPLVLGFNLDFSVRLLRVSAQSVPFVFSSLSSERMCHFTHFLKNLYEKICARD